MDGTECQHYPPRIPCPICALEEELAAERERFGQMEAQWAEACCDASREMKRAEKAEAILREKTNEIDRLMLALADIARVSPDVEDAVDNDGDPYQSQGMADLLERARVWAQDADSDIDDGALPL